MVDPNNIGRPTRARDAFDPALDYESEAPKLTLVPEASMGGKIRRIIPGYGLRIVSGVLGDIYNDLSSYETLAADGATASRAPLPKITFLVRNETGDGGFTETRQYQGVEVYNGAMLPGRFDSIEVDWGDTTQNVPPIVVRVIQGANRVVPVLTDGPTVMGRPNATWDVISESVALPAMAVGVHVLWDDQSSATNRIAPHPYQLPLSLPLLGAAMVTPSLGSDWRSGPNQSFKRRLYGQIVTEDADAFDVLVVSYEAGNPTGTNTWYWYGGRSITRDFSGSFATVAASQCFSFGGPMALFADTDHAFSTNTQPNVGVPLPAKSACYILNRGSTASTLKVDLWYGQL
jgi:hypothetical protein